MENTTSTVNLTDYHSVIIICTSALFMKNDAWIFIGYLELQIIQMEHS